MTARKAGADEFGASDFESEDDFDVGEEEVNLEIIYTNPSMFPADREEVDERTYDALLESQVRRERAAREFQEAQRLAMQEHFIRASHRHDLGTGAMIDQESITWSPERQVLASPPPSKPKPVVPVVTEAPPRRFS